eukprot:COSAG02_NODE_538_length_20609_cov_7.009703_7_plen_87_part_00
MTAKHTCWRNTVSYFIKWASSSLILRHKEEMSSACLNTDEGVIQASSSAVYSTSCSFNRDSMLSRVDAIRSKHSPCTSRLSSTPIE